MPKRPYNYRWQKAREAFLKRHPLCEYCKPDRLTPATVVDHIKPHRGDSLLFWDKDNWQALCKRCHDSDKQAEEKGGAPLGATADGQPIDPRHHWNT